MLVYPHTENIFHRTLFGTVNGKSDSFHSMELEKGRIWIYQRLILINKLITCQPL